MSEITLADAEARLSALVDRAEAGDSVDITRGGKRVARLGPASEPRKRIDLDELRALTGALPASPERAADLVRAMRDGDRY